jgi:peptidoglycan/LPS O-acetylase OafA/YrhL
MEKQQSRVVEIDILRVWGMVGVIGYHIAGVRWGTGIAPDSWSDWWAGGLKYGWEYWLLIMGDQAVPLFLLLSGYSLMLSDKPVSWMYFKRRLVRLLVPFWRVFWLGVAITWLAWQLAPEMMERTASRPFGWLQVWSAFVLLQNWSRTTWNSPVASWWFVPVIMQLYLLYPVLKWLLDRVKSGTYFLVLIYVQLLWNALAFGVLLKLPDWYGGWYSGMSYMLLFGVGMWLGRKRHRIGWWWGLGFWVVGLWLRFEFDRLVLLSEVGLGVGVFSMGWVVASQLLKYQFNWGIWLAKIGDRYSYWVYLVHQPVLYVGFAVAYWLGKRWF